MSTPHSLRFELPHGITIAADAYGNEGDPPVLFLHGGGQTRHAWSGTASRLAERGWYALTMDHRGHGESSWDERGQYQVEFLVQDLRGVLAELTAPPVLVGASLGGITALLTETGQAASVARALVLVDVTPRMERQGVDRIITFMQASPDGFTSLDEVADAVASYLPHRKRPEDTTGLAKNLRVGDDGRYRWHWDPKLLEVWNPNHYTEEIGARLVSERLAAAGRLTIPTLLVRGRLSDVVSEDNAEEFLRAVPHAEYVDLHGAGHMVAGDKNDVFTDAVADFIERHFD